MNCAPVSQTSQPVVIWKWTLTRLLRQPQAASLRMTTKGQTLSLIDSWSYVWFGLKSRRSNNCTAGGYRVPYGQVAELRRVPIQQQQRLISQWLL
jgi:hypothetical protein